MLGRGLVARPDLALQIAAARQGLEPVPMVWDDVVPLLREFWRLVRIKLTPRYAPGRLKQWLNWLGRSYPQAAALFVAVRRENDCTVLDRWLETLAPPAADAPTQRLAA